MAAFIARSFRFSPKFSGHLETNLISNPFSILMVSAVTAFESATYVIERLSARSMTFPKKEMVSLSASTSVMSPL